GGGSRNHFAVNFGEHVCFREEPLSEVKGGREGRPDQWALRCSVQIAEQALQQLDAAVLICNDFPLAFQITSDHCCSALSCRRRSGGHPLKCVGPFLPNGVLRILPVPRRAKAYRAAPEND